LRLEKLEVRAYDTKPTWEQALKEIVDTRSLTRSDLRGVEDRVDKIERKPFQ
jgi:hypothetical protein